jgi:predicted RNase H-like HicB family nuclease
MIHQYVQAALESAHYEMIEDEEPYYGEIPQLQGVWATGKTLEECRRNLSETIEGWILVHNRQNLEIPAANYARR